MGHISFSDWYGQQDQAALTKAGQAWAAIYREFMERAARNAVAREEARIAQEILETPPSRRTPAQVYAYRLFCRGTYGPTRN